ncbi:MAG: methyltransferase domain-containing protein [Balneolaceae bacterium]|nr:methyltransferase domain-containing protein [Balneolaceae bacterium]MDR9408782.1 methyltransferase domain-containing protein [Balneolaceae bacterium]
MADLKKEIRNNFNGAVHYYHEHANLQKNIANRLAKALEPWQYSVPDGPILEIGAGTGFFTRHLQKMFKNRELIITDLSEEMVEFCREQFSETGNTTFRTMDAEKSGFEESRYALITGNYVSHWFKHPAQTLSKIATSLKPGGIFLISFPASESFSNWRQYCLDLGIPYTGNTLPDLEKVVIDLSMGPFQVDYYEDDMIETFSSVFDFFRHLKNLGSSTNFNNRSLSIKQLNLLNEYWLEQEKGRVKVQYHTAFIAAKRDLES